MKSLYVIIVFLAFVAVARSDFNYAGSTAYGPTWMPPAIGYTGACSADASAVSTKYQAFAINFTTPTFVEIVAMYQSSMMYSGTLWIYDMEISQFNVTAAENCENLIKGFMPNGIVPPMFLGLMLPAGNYTIVVSDSTGLQGQFAVNVRIAQHTGNTFNPSKLIVTPTATDLADGIVSSCTTSGGNITQRYDTYTWTQSTSGVFDIHLWFFNKTTEILPMIFLYNGSFPTSGTPNACTDGQFILGNGNLFSYYTGLPDTGLEGGQTYTLVAAPGNATNMGYFGVVIVPTIWGNTTKQPQNFTAPDIPSGANISVCMNDVSPKYYQAFKFVAQYSGYIFDTGDLHTAEFDTAAVLYNGDNTQNPPSMCSGFIIASDTGDGAPIAIFLTPGETYTLIVTAFQPGADQSGKFPMYMLTGLPLGVPDVTTTGSGTSSTSWYMTGAITTGSWEPSSTGSIEGASWMAIVSLGLASLCLF